MPTLSQQNAGVSNVLDVVGCLELESEYRTDSQRVRQAIHDAKSLLLGRQCPKEPILRHIRFRNTSLRHQSLPHFVDLIRTPILASSLLELDLTNCRLNALSSQKIIESLLLLVREGTFPILKILSLAGNSLEVRGTQLLSNLLVQEEPHKCDPKNRDISKKLFNPHLTSLDLSNCSIAWPGQNYTGLRKLLDALSPTLTVVGGDIVRRDYMKSLKRLMLANNRIDAAGARAISIALRYNDTMEELYMDYNPVGEGLFLISTSLLAKNRMCGLKLLSLEGCFLSREYVPFEEPERFGEPSESKRWLAPISVTEDGYSEVSLHAGPSAESEDIASIRAEHPVILEEHSTSGQRWTETGWIPVLYRSNDVCWARRTSLKLLDLKGQIAYQLLNQQPLTKLRLNKSGIDQSRVAGVIALLRSICLKGLQELNLSGNWMGDACMISLVGILRVRAPRLRSLHLRANMLRVGAAHCLAGLLQGSGCSMEGLETLNLGRNQLGSAGCKVICEALHKNCSLTELNVEKNFLGPGAASQLKACLAVNTTLRKLVISDQELPPSLRCDFRVLIGVTPVSCEVKHHVLLWAQSHLAGFHHVDAYIWRNIFAFAGAPIRRAIESRSV